MKAIISTNEFNNITWSVNDSVGVLSFPRTYSIDTILDICSTATEITIYDDNNEFIGKWHISNFLSAETAIVYNISFQIGLPSETTIGQLEDAIIELGSIINSYHNELKLYKQQLEEINNQMRSRENQFNIRINEQQNIIGILDNKISTVHPALVELQSRINSMPVNVNSRIEALENKYNRMADRITMVERRV